MESALKFNNQYESIEFYSLVIQTKGKSPITLKAKLDNNEYADYLTIPACNKVTTLDLPFGVTCKLVSSLPFSYDVPFIPKYHNKHKIEDFLYEITYGNLDYEYAKQNMISPIGGCSAVRNCNFFGRNFDWLYNNDVQFIVHTPTSINYHGTLGVSGIIPGITKSTVDQQDITVDGTDMFKLLPFYLLDGINDKGLFCTHNLVPLDNEDDPTIEIAAKIEERDRIPVGMLVRYILDRFCTTTEAINYITNYVTIYFPDEMILCGYQSHFMIGDTTRTYIIEFENGKLITKAFNYITNFNITDVKFNKDNTIIYPNPSESGINKYGFGLERWDIIANNYKTVNSKSGMESLLDLIKFSNCYNEDSFWYSELVYNSDDDEGTPVTIDTPPENCTLSKQAMIESYEDRDRDNPSSWITCHSSIYDINKRILYVKNQESLIEYKFTM